MNYRSTRNCLNRVIDYNGVFNYSKINNLAVQKHLEILFIVNNDVEFITSNWGLI